jgi:hypothetical protein
MRKKQNQKIILDIKKNLKTNINSYLLYEFFFKHYEYEEEKKYISYILKYTLVHIHTLSRIKLKHY